MAISGAVLGGILTIAGILITILAGVLGWMVLRLLGLEEDVSEIAQSYKGTDVETGHLQDTNNEFERIHSRLDDFEDTMSYQERRRIEEHEELRGLVATVVEALKDADINGDLPPPDDIESSDD